jgi:hypothetical protein
MSTAIAITETTYAERWKYAQALAQAGLLPRQYRDSPGDILLAMEYADALHLPMAQIFVGIHVIEGRPAMSAELMGALVRRAGHRIRMSGDHTQAAAEIVRLDDPGFTYRATFTIENARQAGLLGKDVWKKYPAAMLLARAVSAVCRAGAADVLAGVSYVPEELGDQPDWIEEAPITRLAAVEPVAEEVVVPPMSPAADDPPSPAEVHPDGAPPKRRRRTKAEMEAARAAEEAPEEVVNLPEAELDGPSDPAGEERQEATIAEALDDEWANAWLIDLTQAIEAKDLAGIGVLGSKAAAGNRRDLVTMARTAWNDVHSAAGA